MDFRHYHKRLNGYKEQWEQQLYYWTSQSIVSYGDQNYTTKRSEMTTLTTTPTVESVVCPPTIIYRHWIIRQNDIKNGIAFMQLIFVYMKINVNSETFTEFIDKRIRAVDS